MRGITPKSSISIAFSIINQPFWGAPLDGNTVEAPSSETQSPTTKLALWAAWYCTSTATFNSLALVPGAFSGEM